ncbi:hypothetical protein HY479_01525 [Candidatus Uhrbacteria bacterium]|nr:hypothetical protein [Candidatus Uhrbacteria bacterium]
MRGGTRIKGHPDVWAFLTIVTFPIVLVTADSLGIEGLWPFLVAALATAFVIVLEAAVRGRLWIFEKGFIDHISHPEMPARLVLVLGITLLILESALIFFVASDRRFDLSLLGLVARKQCAARAYEADAARLCDLLTR